MFTYHFVSGVDFETAFNCEPTSAPTIDLFSLYVLFSQCRSCDNNLEDYFIQIHFIFPCMCPRVVDLSIDKSIKIGKSDLIDIYCIDRSVEIDDTLVSFIDLS